MHRDSDEVGTSDTSRKGPQGTQIFSRDKLGELLDTSESQTTAVRGARLVGMGAQLGEKTFPLTSDRTTIGRSQVCDIRLEEPSLSSEHARLVRSEDGWRIINLLSTNGVFVNGEKVFSHRLSHGDVVRLGRVSLKFEDPEAEGNSTGASIAARWRQWLPWALVPIALGAIAFWLLQ